MPFRVKAALRGILALEKGAGLKDPGGRLKVALIWPGDYKTGMSALGYLSIYGFLNARADVLAERFFLPGAMLAREYEREGGPLLSLESQKALSDFDIAAASLSLENDYWLLPRILELGGLSPYRKDRGERGPLVIAGGVAAWANPWPVMPFADMILAGEAEAQWPQLLSAWNEGASRGLSKSARLQFLGRKIPGSFVPEVSVDGFHAPVRPARLNWPPPLDILPPVSPILSPKAEFANTTLVEISRGCPYGCRFCLAGFIFRPHRPWPLEKILKALKGPGGSGEKVGLISPAVADHPDLEELLGILFAQGRSVTLSSLRLSALSPDLAEKLARGRLRGVAVAPEAGSRRLRDIINKDVDEKRILDGVRLLAEAGLSRIKLYFMLGLPGETDEDLTAIIELCRQIRAAARTASKRPDLALSLANFTPKAHTPFENAAMNTEAELRRKGAFILAATRDIPRLTVRLDPPLWSIAQGILARGGPESAALVEAMLKNRGRPKHSLAAIGYSPHHPIHRIWPEERPKPWRVISPAIGFNCLERERKLSENGLKSPPCPPQNACGRCQACFDAG